MIIYTEKFISDHTRTRSILEKFPRAQIIEISNYKNLFDANHGNVSHQPSMIIASAPKNPIQQAPDGYGFDGSGLFFKTSLGCVYDCEYCYLKGMFRGDIPVYFVDFEYIWDQIEQSIRNLRNSGTDENETIWLYSSDYSDIQGMDVFSDFNDFFIPRIEDLDGVMMESRTKSPSIKSLLVHGTPQNVEIAYSLNPQEVIDQYERGTATLDQRVNNINALLDAGWKVGIRIMPLMPIQGYEKIYTEFIQKLSVGVDISRLHSVFIGGLMFTPRDYKRMRKRGLLSDMINKVDDNDKGFIRLNQAYRLSFYSIFKKHFPTECQICLDKNVVF